MDITRRPDRVWMRSERATGSPASTKVVMPFLDDLMLMLGQDLTNRTYLSSSAATTLIDPMTAGMSESMCPSVILAMTW